MPSFRPRSIAPGFTLSRALLRPTLLAGVALGLSGCLSGQDAYYGNGSDAPDVAAVKRLMAGAGLTDPQAKPIDYKPRAPLAVPPTGGELPDPEADATETANLPANWPRDKNAELVALQRERDGGSTASSRAVDPSNSRSSFEEIQAGRREGAGADARPQSAKAKRDEIRGFGDKRLSPTELRTLKLIKPQTAGMLDPNAQPKRNYLVEPPVEYSTPAENAPFALPVEKDEDGPDWVKEMNDRGRR